MSCEWMFRLKIDAIVFVYMCESALTRSFVPFTMWNIECKKATMETENASIQAINSIRVACNCQTSRMSHHHNSHLFPPNKHTTAQATWTERSQQFAITKSKRERERDGDRESGKKTTSTKIQKNSFSWNISSFGFWGQYKFCANKHVTSALFMPFRNKTQPNDSTLQAFELLSSSYFAFVNYFSVVSSLFCHIKTKTIAKKSTKF